MNIIIYKEGKGIESSYKGSHERFIARLKNVLRHHGLVLAPFEKIDEDPETLSLMRNGTLSDPLRKPHETAARQLEHVVVVRGYRVEKVKRDRIDNGAPLISALVGTYRTFPTEVFLGRHNGREWIDDPNYKLPYAESPDSQI